MTPNDTDQREPAALIEQAAQELGWAGCTIEIHFAADASIRKVVKTQPQGRAELRRRDLDHTNETAA